MAVKSLRGAKLTDRLVLIDNSSRKSKIAKWVGRKARRAAWWSTKKAVLAQVAFWRLLVPFQVAVALWITSALVGLVPNGWVTLIGVAAVFAVPAYWFTGLPMPLKSLTRAERLTTLGIAWVLGGHVSASIMTVFCAWKSCGVPYAAAFPAWSLLFGAPWWWFWFGQDHTAQEVREEVAEIDARLQAWIDHGPASSALDQLREVDRVLPGDTDPSRIAWRANGTVQLGKGGSSRMVKPETVEAVAALYDTDIENVSIEPARGSARRFILTVFTRNVLQAGFPFPGPEETFDPVTGIAKIGAYADLELVLYRFYKRFSGPVHDLICGTTDAGKSRLLDLLLAIERFFAFIASVVIDPQGGQSLPAWKSKRNGEHRTAGFATSVEEGMVVLRAVRDEMYARNAYLSDLEYVDEDGFDEEGVDSFDPLEGPSAGLKLIVLTIDEAHRMLAIPEAVAIVEDIAKMSRKCGIKLRLVTQVPLLDQLGGSTTLRDMVVSGNVIVLRTANSLSGQVALNGTLPVDPKLLPKEWEVEREDGTLDRITTAGLGFVNGPGARSVVMRTWFVEKIRHWARTGSVTEVELMAEGYGGLTLNELLRSYRDRKAGRPVQPAAAKLFEEWFSDGKTLLDPAEVEAAMTEPPHGPEIVRAFLGTKKKDGATKNMIKQGVTGLSRQNVDAIVRRLKKAGELAEVRSGWFQLVQIPAEVEQTEASKAETEAA